MGGLDKRTIALVVVATMLVGLAAPFALQGGGLYSDLYRVGVSDDSPYRGAAEQSTSLRAVPPDEDGFQRGEMEVLIRGDEITAANNAKAQSALMELRDAAKAYNAEVLAQADSTAAYPVSVELRYVERAIDTAVFTTESQTSEGGDAETDIEQQTDSERQETRESAGEGFSLPSLDLDAFLPTGGQRGTPGNLAPPFPYDSLILAFAFLIPLNFVVQAYSTSVMNERLGRRGVLLLSAPITRWDIITGKTAPYLGISVAVITAIAVALGVGMRSIAAVIPVAITFLALSFAVGMFARSYKELTFTTVFISVAVTSYVFVPAIFTEITPIAAISPLSIVVLELQGEPAPLTWHVFSSAPLLFSSLVLFSLAGGVYREEDMFTQLPIRHKLIDALASWIHRPRSVAKASILLIPFVAAIELLVIAAIFAAPTDVSIPIVLIAAATVEEIAKSITIYAGYANNLFQRTTRTAMGLGVLAGSGFFIGEKAMHIAQIVGLDTLEVGRAALGTPLVQSPALLVALFLAPLFLHVSTTVISAIGARHGKQEYLVALLAAITAHAGYNLLVVTIVA